MTSIYFEKTESHRRSGHTKLEEMSLLRQIGSKRATYYVLISDNFRNLSLWTRNFPRYQIEADYTQRYNA